MKRIDQASATHEQTTQRTLIFQKRSGLSSYLAQQIRRMQGHVDPYVALFMLLAATGIFFWGVKGYLEWRLQPYDLVFAAGGKGGESYKLAVALSSHINDKFENVTIRVDDTMGTSENIRRLGLNLKTERQAAHFATAQADVAIEHWTKASPEISSELSRTVAMLFEDKVHLLVCSQDLSKDLDITAIFKAMVKSSKKSRIYVPYEAPDKPSGGQVETFLRIARYFGLNEKQHFVLVNDHGADPPFCDNDREKGNVIFRVRADGNEGILTAIQNRWRLAALTNVKALAEQNSALKPSWINQGTYRLSHPPDLSTPEPKIQLRTLRIGRLLLARNDGTIPDFVVKEITRALKEDGPSFTQIKSTRLRQIFLRMPALNDIKTLNVLGVPVHPAATEVYEPQSTLSARLNNVADLYSFYIKLITILITMIIGLNRGMAWFRKKRVDELVEQATKQMAPPETQYSPASLPFPQFTSGENELLSDIKHNHYIFNQLVELLHGRVRENKLEDTFRQAAHDFQNEEISQEAFRTFSEVHKSVRESIETANEKLRRRIVEYYVNALLGTASKSFDNRTPTQIFDQALKVLSGSPAFSRDSFRTLTDAYNLAERKQM